MHALEITGVGLGVGFLLGLTSLGGGSLLTPILVLFLRVNPVVAVGSDLVYQAATRLAGLSMHVKQQSIDRHIVTRLAAGSVPGALLGGFLTKGLHARLGDRFVLSALGVALVMTASTIALEPVLRRRRAGLAPGAAWAPSRARTVATVVAGLFVGLTVSVTSVGAGSMAMALVVLLYPRLSGQRLVGTDLAHGVILLPISALIALKAGSTDLVLVSQLLVGSIPGVLLGSRLSAALPERPLRLTVAGMLMATGLRLLPIGI